MAKTLEDRVAHLEEELSAVRSRFSRNEVHVAVVDNDVKNIPDLIKLESRMMDSRFARLQSEMDQFRGEMNERFDAVIRAVAELVAHKPGKA